MTTRERLANWREVLSRELSAGVLQGEAAISLGFCSSTGKPVALAFDETLVGMLRLSDAGESWSELVAAGYADPIPTPTEREKLERLCALHGVTWDHAARELTVLARPEDLTRAARQLTAAALALDAWRAWYPPLEKRAPDAATIVRRVGVVGARNGWTLEEPRFIKGKLHDWPTDAKLSRSRTAAVLSLLQERTPERVLQQAIGWRYDVPDYGLVLVVPERTAKVLSGSREFEDRVVTVPRLRRGTAELVVKAAETVAA